MSTSPTPLTPDDALALGGRAFSSRLIVGTGKYRDLDETRRAIEASGAEIVTVAVRRVSLTGAGSILEAIPKGVALLPNTAGCYTADEAVRTALISRGVAADRLVAQGVGAAEPVATNGSEQGRARNRRIEIRTLRSPPN
jgi:thiazole synthase ThiGH ThiG subunit